MNIKKLWYKFWLDRKIGKFHGQVDRLEKHLAKQGIEGITIKRWQSLVICVSCNAIIPAKQCTELLRKQGWQFVGSNFDGDLWKK